MNNYEIINQTTRSLLICAKNFDMDKVYNSNQSYRINKVDPKTYSIVANDKYIEIENLLVDDEHGTAYYMFYCSPYDFETFWKKYFSFDKDYEVINRNIEDECYLQRDVFLGRAIRFGYGLRLLRQPLWDTIIFSAMTSLNNLDKINLWEKVCRKFGSEKKTYNRLGEKVIYYTTPSASTLSKVSPIDLVALGMSIEAADNVIGCANQWVNIIKCYNKFKEYSGLITFDEMYKRLDAFGDHARRFVTNILITSNDCRELIANDVFDMLVCLRGIGGELAEYIMISGLGMNVYPEYSVKSKGGMLDKEYGGSFDAEPYEEKGYVGLLQSYYYNRR